MPEKIIFTNKNNSLSEPEIFTSPSVGRICAGYMCEKYGDRYADTIKSAVLLNLIRMILCIAFSFAIILFSADISRLSNQWLSEKSPFGCMTLTSINQ